MWTILVCEKSNDPYTCAHDWEESCVEKHVDVISKTELELALKEMELHDNTGDPLDVGYMKAIEEIRERLERIEW